MTVATSEATIPCDSCGATLPLTAPPEGQTAGSWVCVPCGTPCSGFRNTEADGEIVDNVRPALIPLDRSSISAPSPALVDYVTKLEASNSAVEERRDAARRCVSQTIAVQPVDEQFRPVGSPFLAISRDVSRQGVSLLHSQTVEQDCIVVQLTTGNGTQIQVAMQILRRREMDGFFELAGPLTTRLGADT